jgi:nicotinamide mononucleotide adenylyltransferase
MASFDDIVRGKVAAYGNVRGGAAPKTIKNQNTGRGRGTPAFPTGYNIAKKANNNDDEGFQTQSEPLAVEDLLREMGFFSKYGKPIAAATALAFSQPTGEVNKPPSLGMGDVAATGAKEIYSDVEHFIKDAAKETGVQPNLIRALIGAESEGQYDARSNKGAFGLTQLMPGTARAMGVDPKNPRQNVLGGARYIQTLAIQYGGDVQKVIAAYNMGPTALNDMLRTHRKIPWRQIVKHHLPVETRGHIHKVMKRAPDVKKVTYKTQVAMRETGVTGPRRGEPSALDGKSMNTPGIDDAIRKNGGDPTEEPAKPLAELSDVVGVMVAARIKESMAGGECAVVGRFQPFHVGHSEYIRSLGNQFQRIMIFIVDAGKDKQNPFSVKTIRDLITVSLPDMVMKISIHVIKDTSSASAVLKGKNVQIKTLGDNVGDISGARVRDALLGDEKDQVAKMFDPSIYMGAHFDKMYERLRSELAAAGNKPAETITDAPVPPTDINEMSAGAMSTGIGDTRTGRHGGSAWSSFNPRSAFIDDRDEDDEDINPPTKVAPGAGEQYQQMTRSPNRMLDMANPGTPDNHTPGEELEHHLDDGDDEERPETKKDPTDLSEIIRNRLSHLRRS